MYSQGNEEKIITEFFGEFTGTLLDVGANDGKTFSNSLRLIEMGWSAVLIEPSPKAFAKLRELHKHHTHVHCVNIAIGDMNGNTVLHESGAHVPNGTDVALVSTVHVAEKERWKRVQFEECEVDVLKMSTFQKIVQVQKYDFITIDCEGNDLIVLQQLDLTFTKMLCIEWNGIEKSKVEILQYCDRFGMSNVVYQSGENLILTK